MTEDDGTQPLPSDRSGPGDGGGWLLAGRYRIVDRIGTGGMAEVFRAHDEMLDRDVAVKVFRSGVGEAGDTAGAARQALELQSLARLNHPNLITLYDGSMTGTDPTFLVMELVEGTDLAVRLDSGPLPPDEVRELGAQIAGALAYVHAQGLAHRDVKPANILLGTDGDHAGGSAIRARLSDFGIVRLIGSPRMTSADLTVGTASYLSPEQARGGDVGAAADVYSLGLVLIECLTGVRSFDGPMLEAMAARLSRPPHIPATLPPPWPQLLTAMTAMDPAARPTAAEVAQSFRGSAATPLPPPMVDPTVAAATTTYLPPAAAGYAAAGTTALPPGPPPPVVRPPRPVAAPLPNDRSPSPWRAALFALGGLVVLAIVGLVIYLLTSGSGDNSPGGGTTTSSTPRPSSSHRSTSSSSKSSSSHPPSTAQSTHSTHSKPHKSKTKKTTKPAPTTSSRSSTTSSSSSASSSSSSSTSSPAAPARGGGHKPPHTPKPKPTP